MLLRLYSLGIFLRNWEPIVIVLPCYRSNETIVTKKKIIISNHRKRLVFNFQLSIKCRPFLIYIQTILIHLYKSKIVFDYTFCIIVYRWCFLSMIETFDLRYLTINIFKFRIKTLSVLIQSSGLDSYIFPHLHLPIPKISETDNMSLWKAFDPYYRTFI